jgi:hypothetical protein
MDTIGDGSYNTTVTGDGPALNYSGALTGGATTSPAPGYQYASPPLDGTVTAGNVILADTTGTYAIGDLYFEPSNPGHYIADIYSAGDTVLESATRSWTYTPASASYAGYITTLAGLGAGYPNQYVTTYDLAVPVPVPEPSVTGLIMGLGAMMPIGFQFLKRKLAAQA